MMESTEAGGPFGLRLSDQLGLTPDQMRALLSQLAGEVKDARAEIKRLRAEVARLTEKVVGMDVVGLAYEQRELPGPFGNADTIGSPAALLRDLGA